MTMAKSVCLDTGPLVAWLSRNDHYHSWAKQELFRLDSTAITCESVLSETFFLLKNHPMAIEAVQGMISDGLIAVKPVFSEPDNDVLSRMQKYSFIPGSFADLCLVSLYETRKECHILTLDRDFLHFRDRSGKHLKLIAPFDL